MILDESKLDSPLTLTAGSDTIDARLPLPDVSRLGLAAELGSARQLTVLPLARKQLHTEVFRVGSVQVVIDRADKFFGVMPVIPDTPEGDSADDDVAVNDAV